MFVSLCGVRWLTREHVAGTQALDGHTGLLDMHLVVQQARGGVERRLAQAVGRPGQGANVPQPLIGPRGRAQLAHPRLPLLHTHRHLTHEGQGTPWRILAAESSRRCACKWEVGRARTL